MLNKPLSGRNLEQMALATKTLNIPFFQNTIFKFFTGFSRTFGMKSRANQGFSREHMRADSRYLEQTENSGEMPNKQTILNIWPGKVQTRRRSKNV